MADSFLAKIPREHMLFAIRILSLGALIFASALAVDYYFASNTFCETGASCDVVAKSEFGQRYGIFLPSLGLLAYSATFFGSFIAANRRRLLMLMNACIVLAALGAILFLVVQAYEVKAFCWLCVGIDSCAIAMTIPAIIMLINRGDESKVHNRLPLLSWIGLYILIAGGPLSYGAFKPSQPQSPKTAPSEIQSFYKEGKINVVEISSFDCPHCRELHPQFSKLLQEYGKDVNFKRLTVPIGTRVDRSVLLAYHCAEKQEKGDAFADCMFEAPSTEQSVLQSYVQKCSIEEDEFVRCMKSKDAADAVEASLALVKSSGFKGAPTVWIDQTRIIGFDKSKGMQPYRDAINKVAPKHYTPWLFYIIMALGGILLLAGLGLFMKNYAARGQEEKTA
ncbi:MAG: thioredoxin domain-containing protein [Bradymonadales bacterium]|jgi:predicted DsbA family dithiol-disulfide isomerase/uncharacterized membrane protein